MNENNLNASAREVVQPESMGGQWSNGETAGPQYENGAEVTDVTQREFTEPEVEEMSDEEFESYINSAQSGDGEVQAEAAQNDFMSDQDGNNTGDAVPADAAKAEPFKVFSTQEEYQSVIDGIIGERLKKSREGMETLEGLKQHALNFYGIDDGDAAICQLIDDLQYQNAEKNGVSVDKYRQQMQDSIDAQKYRNEQGKQMYRQMRIADIQQRWQNEANELKKIVPDFNFAKAMANNTFYENIVNGSSVSNAYLAANSAKADGGRQRRAIAQNGNMRGSSPGKVEANPATMTDNDFKRYIERIRG
ncbi:MAG: hypothetical protein HFE49_07340 [Clostridia bacterium]|nr:hypothetical protein [Clostridia bacterium]